LSFFSWPLFILFLLAVVCTMVRTKRTNNG
jgi:hypothetical protein